MGFQFQTINNSKQVTVYNSYQFWTVAFIGIFLLSCVSIHYTNYSDKIRQVDTNIVEIIA